MATLSIGGENAVQVLRASTQLLATHWTQASSAWHCLSQVPDMHVARLPKQLAQSSVHPYLLCANPQNASCPLATSLTSATKLMLGAPSLPSAGAQMRSSEVTQQSTVQCPAKQGRASAAVARERRSPVFRRTSNHRGLGRCSDTDEQATDARPHDGAPTDALSSCASLRAFMSGFGGISCVV